ncbi:Glycosyl phosphatidyl inositol protein transamidase complex subunit [Saxophila tyrrhenica]|uniref:Glycosyl phosphatidyl inositol protein transamidase complex subunit n=1 Tax=Saxophila tyrrhenica TaxID=1690608 RepID=A0AAV9PJY4_9PEZI|nr:Glycosyl phosphatidyl inositol protein transamidase complex subunit [Saxophila tyrrhenica]
MALSTRLLALRRSPVLLKLPPYLSALCIVVGVVWLLLLPLNEYSRSTYISENAILPGQVHTYFGGSEHNIFRAYRQEVWHLSERSDHDRIFGLEHEMRSIGLKAATQEYSWTVAGEEIKGMNVYGLLQGPRADATEAMVLMAAWRNFDGQINYSGVALALSLVRYFKRWSIWSKDIILLITDDSTYGPEAWVSAYHSTSSIATSSRNISALPIKAGALQGAVALDYPAGPWGQRFEKLDVLYDGINGALPNLDLLNTAVSVANSQMGIGCVLHNTVHHFDTYSDRLLTLTKGLLTQSAGHATGPHSAFMPYHVDAVTLRTVGDGWHDEMSLGRATESLVRSLNNLLEHLHQSFFFYILLNTNRFVSIGNYLPAAMIIAGSFTISALALWVQSGKASKGDEQLGKDGKKATEKKMELVSDGDDLALVPKSDLVAAERKIFLPATILLSVHLAGLVPLYLLNNLNRSYLTSAFHFIALATLLLPFYLSLQLSRLPTQQIKILQSFSLLFLGATLSMLATINFSLAFIIGLLCAPLSFLRPLPRLFTTGSLKQERTVDDAQAFVASLVVVLPSAALYFLISPPVVLYVVASGLPGLIDPENWMGLGRLGLDGLLVEMARGWVAQGVWTGLVVWGVWWPAWVVGGAVLGSAVVGIHDNGT